MKILALADIHGADITKALNKKLATYKPELVIVAGDLTNFGPASSARDFVDKIPITTIAIPGNCDPKGVIKELESSKAISLHNKKIKFGNLTFVGFGGSNYTPFNTVLEFSEAKIYRALSKLAERNCILVTHCPAKGILDLMKGKGNLGSEAIAKIVREYEPRLHLSAHIHEARGIEQRGKTLHINPGQASKGYAALVKINKKIKAELI